MTTALTTYLGRLAYVLDGLMGHLKVWIVRKVYWQLELAARKVWRKLDTLEAMERVEL